VIALHSRLHDMTHCICYRFFKLQTTQDSETLLTAGNCGILVQFPDMARYVTLLQTVHTGAETVQWAQEAVSLGLKRPGSEIHLHLVPSLE
jgi:hypothetical protein